MSIEVKLRRGTTAEHTTFTGAEGEITIDTTKDTAVVHDGSTAGGHPLALEANVAKSLVADYLAENAAGHTGLYFAYKAGKVRDDNAIATVAADTVLLADDETNYIEVTPAGVVSANVVGYTAGSIPLFTVITASGAISSVVDDRSFISAAGGGGGSSTGGFMDSIPTLTTYDVA